MQKKIVCLMGPTAAGKTQIALALAAHFPIEIISVDSALVYRDLDIGTAKPSLAERSTVPHHLIDILDPNQSYSVADFCQQALELSEAIIMRGRIPLLVGGTMMYYRALQQGLSVLPSTDSVIRNALNDEALFIGREAMHQALHQVDPVTAAKLHPNDTQRIQRALEVYRISGKPLSSYFETPANDSTISWINILLMPENRTWLHQRIETRFIQMIEQGFIDEVQMLMSKWRLTPESPAMRSVGYRQALQYLAGSDTLATFKEKGIAATRQLAKRQLTWLRHWPNGECIPCDKPEWIKQINQLLQQY